MKTQFLYIKILLSKRFSFSKKSFKYFIGFKNGKKVSVLFVIPLKISTYDRNYDKTKYMSFMIKNEKLLGNYNEIWNKVSNTIKKGFDSKPVHSKKHSLIK